MKILDKYILLSIFKSSLSTMVALVIIFSSFQFIEELEEIGKERYTFEVAIEYILLLIPSIFNSLVVLSLLIGTVFSLGQLNSNKELQIFHTASISQRGLIEKTLKFPFLISIILFTFLESITPQTLTFADQIKNQSLGKNSYQDSNRAWFKKDNEILFMAKDKNSNYDIKVFNIEGEKLLSYLESEGGIFFGTDIVAVKSKKVEIKNNDNFITSIESSIDSNVKFNLDFEEIESLKKNVKTMSLLELLKIANLSYQDQNNEKEIILEIISRIIRPFTLIGMILVALPFVLNTQRDVSIGKRVLLTTVIGTITHLLTKISSVVSLKFDPISIIGPILPTLILILLGSIIIKTRL